MLYTQSYSSLVCMQVSGTCALQATCREIWLHASKACYRRQEVCQLAGLETRVQAHADLGPTQKDSGVAGSCGGGAALLLLTGPCPPAGGSVTYLKFTRPCPPAAAGATYVPFVRATCPVGGCLGGPARSPALRSGRRTAQT